MKYIIETAGLASIPVILKWQNQKNGLPWRVLNLIPREELACQLHSLPNCLPVIQTTTTHFQHESSYHVTLWSSLFALIHLYINWSEMDKLYTLSQEMHAYCISSSMSICLLVCLREARKKVPNNLPPIFESNSSLAFPMLASGRVRTNDVSFGNKQSIFATSCKSIHLP